MHSPTLRQPEIYAGPATDLNCATVDVLDIGRVLAGLVLLVLGGEGLVRGAGALARRVGISALVVGLTVVSVATSAPELAVSVDAALRGEPDLALGNVVGSNIANVLMILGISAIVVPLAVRHQLVKLDLPVMVGMSFLLLVMALDGALSTTDGVILIVLVATHTIATVLAGRRHPEAASSSEAAPGQLPIAWCISYLVVGLGMLVVGARLLVDGAVGIATAFGVSSLVIGLTVVAVGTSLPELAASMSAVRQGERDIIVGNVVGSNIFNIGLVLGVPAVISGGGLPVPASAVAFDIPLMIATTVVLLPVVLTGFEVQRWEGAMFAVLYVAYLSYVVLAATDHDALAGFDTVMVAFVFPLVATALALSVAHEIRKRRRIATRAP